MLMQNNDRVQTYQTLIDRYLEQINITVDQKEKIKAQLLDEMLQNHLETSQLHDKILSMSKQVNTTHIMIKQEQSDTRENTLESISPEKPEMTEIEPEIWTKTPPIDDKHIPLTDEKLELVSKPETPNINAIDPEAITQKAKEIATWKNNYDTLIWLWAESTLEIKLQKQPERKDIVDLAELYAKREKNIDKIQWYLAENLLKLNR